MSIHEQMAFREWERRRENRDPKNWAILIFALIGTFLIMYLLTSY